MVLCTGGQIFKGSLSAEPHGGANKSSAPPCMDETVEKRSASMFSHDTVSPPLSSPLPVGVLHNSTTALCVCVCCVYQCTLHGGRGREREVLEGDVSGSLVCFLFKLLLQNGLLFHWFLCGPAGFCAIRNRAWLLNINAQRRHGADRFRLILL